MVRGTTTLGLMTMILLQGIIAEATPKQDNVILFDGSSAPATLIIPKEPTLLERLAAEKLARSFKEVWGFQLNTSTSLETPRTRAALVLGTTVSSPIVERLAANTDLSKIGSEGFFIRTVREGTQPASIVIGGNGGKGVYNGAIYLTEFILQKKGESVVVPWTELTRTPAIPLRGTYNLACWGLAPRYSLENWKRVIDAMLDDGMNYIFFWVAGLFRSQIFPETFIYPETPLTAPQIRELARYSNERGIDFYLGSGVFAWFGIDTLSQYHAEFREVEGHMCRTLPEARKAMLDYLIELNQAIPEAKGFMLEIGCEGKYHCSGKLCQTPLDRFGSKQIGFSELSFLKELSEELWLKNPQAKLVWLVGYPSHKWDVQYYNKIRTEFQDPRYFFLDVRQNWSFADLKGTGRPLKYCHINMMHWDGYYRLPLRDLSERIRRTVEEGLVGYTGAFEPGFSTRSIYGNQIPFPVDLIPYRLTRFVSREFSWDPELNWGQFRQRLGNRFFGQDEDPLLVDLLLGCFSLIQNGPIQGSRGELVSPPSGITAYAQLIRPRLVEIEKSLDSIAPESGPKSTKVGIPLIRKAVTDLRSAYSID